MITSRYKFMQNRLLFMANTISQFEYYVMLCGQPQFLAIFCGSPL